MRWILDFLQSAQEVAEILRDVTPVSHGKHTRWRISPNTSARETALTWCTHCSLDRWSCIPPLAESWTGPISVAVFCPHPKGSEEADIFLEDLSDRVASLPRDHRCFPATSQCPADSKPPRRIHRMTSCCLCHSESTRRQLVAAFTPANELSAVHLDIGRLWCISVVTSPPLWCPC